MRSSVLFHKNLRSAAGKFAHSAACGNTYTPLFIYVPQRLGNDCLLKVAYATTNNIYCKKKLVNSEEMSVIISYQEIKRQAKVTASGKSENDCCVKVESNFKPNTGIASFRFPKS